MQNKVKEFNENILKNQPLSASLRILDIQSELGELAKEILKSTNYGKKDFEVTNDFYLEFGDTLYSLLCLANETGINAEESLNAVLDKYHKRFIEKGNAGSGN